MVKEPTYKVSIDLNISDFHNLTEITDIEDCSRSEAVRLAVRAFLLKIKESK